MTYENPWLYQNKVFDDDDIPEGTVGFVYLITLKDSGLMYIGRKILTSKRKKVLKGKVKRVIAASDWKNYFGSSEQMKLYILTNGKNSVKREILRLCKSKSEMAYFESKEIFVRDALLKDEYINKWLTCQINGRNLNYLKKDVDNDIGQNTPDSSQSESLQTDIG